MVMVPGATVGSRSRNELGPVPAFKELMAAGVGEGSGKRWGRGTVGGWEKGRKNTLCPSVRGPQGHREVREMPKSLGERFETFKTRHLQGGMHLREARPLR